MLHLACSWERRLELERQIGERALLYCIDEKGIEEGELQCVCPHIALSLLSQSLQAVSYKPPLSNLHVKRLSLHPYDL
jgi:hypothetical protein